ncbi:MAG: hypothetical protein EXS35_19045 [Pedosphaera sp.]|nr:hypothetical protein [Pedosphaera sp.]
MKTKTQFRFALLIAVALLGAGLTQAAPPAPLLHAHAHNDYEHKRPLFDALEQGFCSVEADIHLVDGKLLVAHDVKAVKPERTLQALYLDPLRERVKRNGGHVFTNGPEFTLLIDIKTSWTNTYPVLRAALTNYADVLTTFRAGAKQTNAITVIISGNRSREMFAGEAVRYAAYDGTLADLGSSVPLDLIPWISADWKRQFAWDGNGSMPDAGRKKLREIVTQAHDHGRQVRFWAAPDVPACWTELRAAGVDLINTDDLAGLADFFKRAGGHPR